MYDPDLGVTLPEPVVKATSRNPQPLPVSNPPFTMVFRAASGFGVADGVTGTVLVGVLVAVSVGFVVALRVNVRVLVWLLVGMRVFVLVTVRVLLLVTVRVAVRVLVRGLGIVRVAVRVFVRVFVLVSVAIRVCTLDPPDACGASGHCTQATTINSSTIPVSREEGVPIQPRFNPSYALPTIFDFPGPSLPNSNQPHASVR